jgi:hypothetical protein
MAGVRQSSCTSELCWASYRNLYRRTRAATASRSGHVRDRKFIPPTCLRLAKTLRIDFAEAMSANLRREMTENCGSRPRPLRGGKRSCGKHDWGVCPQHGRQFGAGVRGASAPMAMLASGVLAGAPIPRRRRANSNQRSPGCSARPVSCRACVRSAWSSCGMGSETSCVALASLRCSSTQHMYCTGGRRSRTLKCSSARGSARV